MLKSFFRRRSDPRAHLLPLYQSCVQAARAEHWYIQGQVPDTLDGRFDMLVAVLGMVLLRLEDEAKPQESVWLTELFVEDMDGNLRQMGIGDLIVGKHIGRMMSALGGRTAAYRAALEDTAPQPLHDALLRNLYRGEVPAEEAIDHVAARLRESWQELRMVPVSALLEGRLA